MTSRTSAMSRLSDDLNMPSSLHFSVEPCASASNSDRMRRLKPPLGRGPKPGCRGPGPIALPRIYRGTLLGSEAGKVSGAAVTAATATTCLAPATPQTAGRPSHASAAKPRDRSRRNIGSTVPARGLARSGHNITTRAQRLADKRQNTPAAHCRSQGTLSQRRKPLPLVVESGLQAKSQGAGGSSSCSAAGGRIPRRTRGFQSNTC